MLFRFLKLARIDIETKIAEIKADVAAQIRSSSQRLTRKARTTAVVAGLFLCAALMLLMTLIVGLIALYKWGELHYGVFTGLALDAGLLVVLTAILVTCGWWLANRADGSPPGPLPVVRPQRTDTFHSTASPYRASYRSTARADDLIEPLFALLGIRTPLTRHPAVDQLLGRIAVRARTTTDDVVNRASELVRDGDRTTMLSVLGAAALVGWLMARAATDDDTQFVR